MGLLDRLLLFLFSIGFAALAVVGFLAGLEILIGPREVISGIREFYQDPGLRWAVAGVSLFALVISVRLLAVGLMKKRALDPGVDRETEIGHIRISLKTIESLAVRAARKVRGIRDLTARVRHNGDHSSVGIGMKIIVDGERPIQELSEQLQLTVKEQVEKIAGVGVDQVSVYVAQTIQPDKSRVRVE
ncbi:alkaline shock response membrane anchor protein AmaP [Lihuaxuella thermophila]|uniref:Uncharacterized conserved protein YloU, alkaline shock protein (Asp23) family n=1 Tax=Lihuaxuella thermophila TaxID=1173111 RepID=A0A1H8EV19_9BACL|nr:alkaline shock response membrane anchor protein AmaP [Lihuaxuella thermophila]SEN22588.1 Uncharacterized conserved protein YloU, alkaline shock protein (Asp23) family [Lihuaxuella thermophila]